MALFGKRRQSAPDSDPATTAHQPGSGQVALDAFVARRPGVVDLHGATPRFVASPAEAARGGPLDGKLEGWVVEFWEVPNATTPFAALVIDPTTTIFTILLCVRGGQAGDYIQIFDGDGGTSRQGPVPGARTLEAWSQPTFDMILAVLAQQVMRADGVAIVDDRVRAASAPAFLAYANGNRPVPLVESWVVVERIDGPGPGARWIEIWGRTVDRVREPPNPYHTPWVAAAYLDGHIVAMAAVETMPDRHDEIYFIVFEDTIRRNLGAVVDIANPSVFRQAALEQLTPLLQAAW